MRRKGNASAQNNSIIANKFECIDLLFQVQDETCSTRKRYAHGREPQRWADVTKKGSSASPRQRRQTLHFRPQRTNDAVLPHHARTAQKLAVVTSWRSPMNDVTNDIKACLGFYDVTALSARSKHQRRSTNTARWSILGKVMKTYVFMLCVFFCSVSSDWST